VNPRARDLASTFLAALASIGPGARGASVHEFMSWTLVQIQMATDEALQALAEDRGLDERGIERTDVLWWRQAAGRWPGLRIVARGPNHEGAPPS
jgi:hypothetical protein